MIKAVDACVLAKERIRLSNNLHGMLSAKIMSAAANGFFETTVMVEPEDVRYCEEWLPELGYNIMISKRQVSTGEYILLDISWKE